MRRFMFGTFVALLLCALPMISFAADAVPTPSSCKCSASADIRHGVAAEAIEACAPVYIDSASSNKLRNGDIDANAISADVIGVACGRANADGAPLSYAVYDPELTPGFSVTKGTTYSVSGTAGVWAPLADLASGDYPGVLAIGTSSTTVKLGATNLKRPFCPRVVKP